MKIYNREDIVLLDIEMNDNSYRYRSIMKGENITLYYSLTSHIEIPVGSYIILDSGERYTLYKPENFSKKGTRNFEYTVQFDSDLELFKRYKYKFITVDKTTGKSTFNLKFSLTAKPIRFLDLLVQNLNQYNKETGQTEKWKIGNCIDASEKVLSFSHDCCYDALTRVASEFNTEWEIDGKTIHLCRVEKFKDDPLPLSYGKGKGFKTGIGRQTQGDKPPVTRLYVQGGERNINVTDYGSRTLLLPVQQTLQYEERTYESDEQGIYIRRIDKIAADINEDSLDASHIYPKWEGTIAEVIEIDEENNLYEFRIENPTAQPDFTDMRIPGEKATVIFQSGALTGREFDIVQENDTEITGYDHSTGSFRLNPLKTDGTTLPNQSMKMAVGDRFGVFNISLPPEYICDDSNESGASWDMFRESVRYMYEHEEEQFSFTGELDGIWAKKRWPNIGGKIIPGGYIEFSDTQFQPEGIRIRITGVKDYINNPHSPEIELSNVPIAGFVADDIKKIEAKEVLIDNNRKESIQHTIRRWRDAIETMGMLEKAIDGFTEGVKPIWVQAMSVLVGDESLQFKFAEGDNYEKLVEPNIVFDQAKKQLKISYPRNTVLVHYTLGGNTLSPTPQSSNHRTWSLNGIGFESPALTSPNPYYLYVICGKEEGDNNALFELTTEPYKLDGGDVYNFLVGTLSSEYEGLRSFVTVHGFTEILPGRITVDRIISPDGVQYWDMAHKAFRIGDTENYLSYNADHDGRLILKGTLVQSPSGDISPIGTFRGEWKVGFTYYIGDEVTRSGSTYKCIRQNENTYPPNQNYWTVTASRGNDGRDGRDGDEGPEGIKGRQGPALVFRGTLTSENVNEIYYINEDRLDVVYYNGTYYSRHGDKEKISGVYPTNNNDKNWKEFGASFSSVATDLLLAQVANIAGWQFDKEWISSQDNTIVLNGNKPSEKGELPVIAIGDNARNGDTVNLNTALKLWRDGTLTVGDGTKEGETKAGMTGTGHSSDSVRFWAGSKFDNRNDAPFRITESGDLYADNANLTGSFRSSESGKTRISIDSDGVLTQYDQYNRPVSEFRLHDYSNPNISIPQLWLKQYSSVFDEISWEFQVSPRSLSFKDEELEIFRLQPSGWNNTKLVIRGLPSEYGLDSKPTGTIYRDDNGFLKVKMD